MSDEERKAIEELWHFDCAYNREIKIVLNLIEKQSKEIEELKKTLKCTQDSWFEDTQQIEEMKKQLDLDNECEIALNNKIMDLENNDKKWEDKIKAKIEEWQKEKELYNKDEDREWGQFNNWDWIDTIINEMQSLLEKE